MPVNLPPLVPLTKDIAAAVAGWAVIESLQALRDVLISHERIFPRTGERFDLYSSPFLAAIYEVCPVKLRLAVNHRVFVGPIERLNAFADDLRLARLEVRVDPGPVNFAPAADLTDFTVGVARSSP